MAVRLSASCIGRAILHRNMFISVSGAHFSKGPSVAGRIRKTDKIQLRHRACSTMPQPLHYRVRLRTLLVARDCTLPDDTAIGE
jgi:hypothetical protein